MLTQLVLGGLMSGQVSFVWLCAALVQLRVDLVYRGSPDHISLFHD